VSLPQVSEVSGDASEQVATLGDAKSAPVVELMVESIVSPTQAIELALLEAAKAGQWQVVTALARELEARRDATHGRV
jgi:hypothetical protein